MLSLPKARRGFDPRVVALMAELFEGKTCSVCGAPARRLRPHRETSSHQDDQQNQKVVDVFYCHDCYPGVREPEPLVLTPIKDHSIRSRKR